MNIKTLAAAICLIFGSAASSFAATVTSAGTGYGGFTLSGGSGVIVDAVVSSAYNDAPTTPPSKWVWDSANTSFETLTFAYQFDLTGFDISTASLSGIFQVDNVGVAKLNSTTMRELTFGFPAFAALNTITAGSSAFVAGINTVFFEVEDQGAPGAFRTSFIVEADVLTPVPLPAGGLLLLSGLFGVAALKCRKTRDA